MKFSSKKTYKKLLIIFFIVAIAPMITIGTMNFINTKEIIKNQVFESKDAIFDENARKIHKMVNHFTRHTKASVNFPALKELIMTKDVIKRESLKSHLLDAFKSIQKQHASTFFLIRYIDETGQEILALDSKNGKALAIEEEDLQNRATSDYFTKSITLNRGEVYVSPIALNAENGEIETPHYPITHFASPIFDDNDEKRGVFVVNVYMNPFLDSLRNNFERELHGSSALVDQDGNFLLNKEKGKEFGLELKANHNLYTENPSLKEKISGASVKKVIFNEGQGKVMIWRKIFFDKTDESKYWILFSEMDTEALLGPVASLSTITLVVALCTFAFIIFISMFLSSLLSKNEKGNISQRKILIVFFFIAILPILTIGIMNFRLTKDVINEQVFLTKDIIFDENARKINKLMSHFVGHTTNATEYRALSELVNNAKKTSEKREEWKGHLLSAFENVQIQHSNEFYKLRYIDELGQEVVALKSKDGKPYRESKKGLENKSDRTYFKNTMKLENGNVFVSVVDLEKEGGKIVSPNSPILRFATPIFNSNNERKGILVINVKLSPFLGLLEMNFEKEINGKSILIDHEGYFLSHPEKEKEFGKHLNTEHNYFTEKQDLRVKLKETSVEKVIHDPGNGEVLIWRKIYFNTTNESSYWILFSRMDEDIVFAPVGNLRNVTLFVALLTFAFIIFISFFIPRFSCPKPKNEEGTMDEYGGQNRDSE